MSVTSSRAAFALALLLGACAPGPKQAPSPTPAPYEYKVITRRDDRRIVRELSLVLNEMADDGWEFVECSGEGGRQRCTFKRKKMEGR